MPKRKIPPKTEDKSLNEDFKDDVFLEEEEPEADVLEKILPKKKKGGH